MPFVCVRESSRHELHCGVHESHARAKGVIRARAAPPPAEAAADRRCHS